MDNFLKQNSVQVKLVLQGCLQPRWKKIACGAVFFIFISWLVIPVLVQASMSGSTYQIPWDALDGGGGEDQSGSTYSLRDSQGEPVGGTSIGSTYALRSGYRQQEEFFLENTLSTTQCNLGIITTQTVQACLVSLTTSTNAPGGYQTTVVSGGMINGDGDDLDAVSDGSITAGSEEYGISTEDDDSDVAQFSGGSITSSNCQLELAGPLSTFTSLTTTPQSVMGEPSGSVGEVNNVCIAASAATSSVSGGYQDTLTFITTGSF